MDRTHRQTLTQRISTWIVTHHIALQRACLLLGIGLLAYALLPGGALAQGVDGDITKAAAEALKIVKALWAFVFIACIFGLIYYVVAYFTQGILPMLWQPVSGNWGRNAIMIGVGANLLMGILITAATAAASGWAG